jgi:hypothetical protein
MHALKNNVVAVMAGAAVVVGGLNVASYAIGGHHAAATHRPAAHGSAMHWTAPGRGTPVAAKVRHGAYVFKVPHHTPLPFFFRLKGVPIGRYVASLNVATTSATGPVVPFCFVPDSTSPYAITSYGQDHGDLTDDIAINSASGTVKLAHKGEVGLVCQDADESYNAQKSKNTLVLTPIHRVADLKGSQQSPTRNIHPQFGR